MGKKVFRKGPCEVVFSNGVCSGLYTDGVYDKIRNQLILRGETVLVYEGRTEKDLEDLLRKEGFIKV
jgi:hypothetical protein